MRRICPADVRNRIRGPDRFTVPARGSSAPSLNNRKGVPVKERHENTRGCFVVLAVLPICLAMAGCARTASPFADDDRPSNFSTEQDANIRQRQQALLERWSSPIAKVIVTRDDIAQFRDRRASDIMRRLPGMFMGSPARGRSTRLRGIGTQYTQILVNGERISGSGERRQFELDRIPADMIERIEVIKSPTAEYSSDAVAGIVNIILRQAPDPSVQELMDELRRRRESAQSETQ